MAKAYASIVIEQPIDIVWALVRDFNAMPKWHTAIPESMIEDDRRADAVGAIRRFSLADGSQVRERLLSLDDRCYRFSYGFETPAFPVRNYIAEMSLIPVTQNNATFVQWSAHFDEAAEDEGKYAHIISNDVFAAGLASLQEAIAGNSHDETGPPRPGMKPAKVFCSSILAAPIDTVWQSMRDFSGMDGWHPDIEDMHMEDGVSCDTVGGVRRFALGGDTLREQLTFLDDSRYAFAYRMLDGPQPWLDYCAGVQLYPVTSSGATLAVWQADWTAAVQDDLTLVLLVHDSVFQLALDTLDQKLSR
ncbi:SRPBCC family protein [Salinisphaera aquimarina]|uniref:SRPBCC family protein n=1 Tax=Salinisphaera aquimarina TaxID=2094031 RepID=A0ABV7EMF6_9GAMM